MAPGEVVVLAGYEFRFDSIGQYQGPNYQAYRGIFSARSGSSMVAGIAPEKRYYPVREQPMTEAGIDAGFWRDLMVTLSRPMEGEAWAVSVQVKPFVRWIWLGAVMVALGALLAALDKRYRRRVANRQRSDQTVEVVAHGAV